MRKVTRNRRLQSNFGSDECETGARMYAVYSDGRALNIMTPTLENLEMRLLRQRHAPLSKTLSFCATFANTEPKPPSTARYTMRDHKPRIENYRTVLLSNNKKRTP